MNINDYVTLGVSKEKPIVQKMRHYLRDTDIEVNNIVDQYKPYDIKCEFRNPKTREVEHTVRIELESTMLRPGWSTKWDKYGTLGAGMKHLSIVRRKIINILTKEDNWDIFIKCSPNLEYFWAITNNCALRNTVPAEYKNFSGQVKSNNERFNILTWDKYRELIAKKSTGILIDDWTKLPDFITACKDGLNS